MQDVHVSNSRYYYDMRATIDACRIPRSSTPKHRHAHICWSDIPARSSYKRSVTEHTLIELVEYLIDNIYVSVGNRVYRQCVGIPMGTDCAPLLANLFLFYYEYRYMKNLIKYNLTLAKKFNHTMRYILMIC